jgi:hypothetical protein
MVIAMRASTRLPRRGGWEGGKEVIRERERDRERERGKRKGKGQKEKEEYVLSRGS